MASERPKPEEIFSKLPHVAILMGRGLPHQDAIRRVSDVEQSYYHWWKQYGGMGIDQL